MMLFVLKNPFYYGVFKYKGELHEGKHEPIITKKLFDQAQEMLKKRGRHHEKKIHNYIFTDFMKCGTCGCAITAEKHKGHIYYRYTKKKGICAEKYIREEELKEQILDEVKKVSCMPDGWPDKMLKQLEIDGKEGLKAKTGEIRAFDEKVKVVEDKLDKLLDSHLEGLVEKDIYLNKKEKLINEKVGLEENLKAVRQNGNNWLEPMRDFIFLLIKAKKIAGDGDSLELKAFLKNIGSNFILQGKKFGFLAEFEWALACRRQAFSNWLRGLDSNQDTRLQRAMSYHWTTSEYYFNSPPSRRTSLADYQSFCSARPARPAIFLNPGVRPTPIYWPPLPNFHPPRLESQWPRRKPRA